MKTNTGKRSYNYYSLASMMLKIAFAYIQRHSIQSKCWLCLAPSKCTKTGNCQVVGPKTEQYHLPSTVQGNFINLIKSKVLLYAPYR